MQEADEPEQLDDVQQYERGVGRLINRFASMESSLFAICHAALGTSKRKAAVVFFRQSAFGSRVNLITELLEQHISIPADADEWDVLTSEIGKVQTIRNLIAHAPFRRRRFVRVGVDCGPDGYSEEVVHGAMWDDQERSIRPSKTARATLADLTSANASLDALLPRLDAFVQRVTAQPPGRMLVRPKGRRKAGKR